MPRNISRSHCKIRVFICCCVLYSWLFFLIRSILCVKWLRFAMLRNFVDDIWLCSRVHSSACKVEPTDYAWRVAMDLLSLILVICVGKITVWTLCVVISHLVICGDLTYEMLKSVVKNFVHHDWNETSIGMVVINRFLSKLFSSCLFLFCFPCLNCDRPYWNSLSYSGM